MWINIVAAVLALAAGTAISLINASITKKAMKKNTNGAIGVSVVRSMLNVACLVGTYFVARTTGCSIIYPLIAAAAGLTIPSLYFALKMAKNISMENASNNTKEDEDE